MATNIELLDKNKQYGIFCVSKKKFSPVAVGIRLKAKQTIKILGYDKTDKDKELWETYGIATHSAICIYENFDWWIYESHFKTGVRKILLTLWLENKDSDCYFHEDTFIVDKLHKAVNDKKPYGKVDMPAFFNEYFIRIFNKNYISMFHFLDQGDFCTEIYCKARGAPFEIFEGIGYYLNYCLQEPCMHQYWAVRNRNVFKIN